MNDTKLNVFNIIFTCKGDCAERNTIYKSEEGGLNISNENKKTHNIVQGIYEIKNIKIEPKMEIDERVLLIETLAENNFYLDNVIQKIRKYGGNVIGIIILINQKIFLGYTTRKKFKKILITLKIQMSVSVSSIMRLEI